jgi:hypothetical protein
MSFGKGNSPHRLVSMEKHMKNKSLIFLSAVLLIALVSMSCRLFSRLNSTPQPENDGQYFGPTGGPLNFEPEFLHAAQESVKYEEKVLVTGNNTPVGDFFLSEGALPPGLELVFLDGEDAALISGIPEETGTFVFTVSVWCFGTQVSGQAGEKEYRLVVEK